mgnify:CR=1 FL=1
MNGSDHVVYVYPNAAHNPVGAFLCISKEGQLLKYMRTRKTERAGAKLIYRALYHEACLIGNDRIYHENLKDAHVNTANIVVWQWLGSHSA